jgi:histone-lysine N-methyltransferase SETMAR
MQRTGRPESLDREDLKAAVDADPFLTTRELANTFDCSPSTILHGLRDIGKVNKRGRWLPHKLTENNKNQRSTTCSCLLSQAKRSGFMDSIVTGDEKWIMFDNTSNRSQWVDSDQVPVGVPKPHRFVKKAMLCVWWNTRGIVHFEVLESGQTVNSALYCQQLDRVRRGLNDKHVYPGTTRLLHDNARPHVSMATQNKIEELGWEVLPHAPYSPDLAPSDYHLFRSMEHSLRDVKFQDVEQVRSWVADYFASQPPEFYERGIRSLRDRWRSTIATNGEYYID